MNNEMTTVLYVDDNARSRSLLGRMLAEYGFEMITAGDPIEVLCRCAEIYFDLALLDYRLTTGSGCPLRTWYSSP